VAVVATALLGLGAVVLACGVMISTAVHQPGELMYQHKSSWGGFLRSEKNARSANDLSINDVQLLKIAEKDIKKQHKAAVKTELKDKAAYSQEKLSVKLAQLKKQKAKAKEAAVEAAIAKAEPQPVPKAASVHAKKGLNLSRRDKQLLNIANKQIKKHHAQELAEEKRDKAAEKSVTKAKNAARAAYLAKHPRAVHTSSNKHVTAAKSVAKNSAPAVAAPVDTQTAATEKALQAVGVDGAALKLLASAEKSQSLDTKKGNALRQRDTKALIQMAKNKNGMIFDDSKARAEAAKENRHYAHEASIGLTKATQDDDNDYREAWKQ